MLSEHPLGWKLRKLASCAKYQEGYVNPPQGVPEYFGDDVRWLRAVDLNDSFVSETSRRLSFAGFQSAGKAAKLFPPGSLAISKSGTIGRLGILQNEMCGNRAVINIEPNADIDTRFLFYSMMLHRERIIQLADGSVQKNLYVSQLGLVDLFVPSLSEQRAIAETLGSLDDKIEQNRRTGRKLEALARAVFKAWFVDFEPVKAKAAGATAFPGMSRETFATLPTRLFDSELGPVPEGWSLATIKEQTSVIQYGLTTSATTDPVGPQFLRITDIRGGTVNWNSVPFCSANASDAAKYRLVDGDIVVARTGASTGENLYVVEPPHCVFASYLVRFQFPSRSVARIVAEYMRTESYQSFVKGTIGGSAQPNANAQMLAAAPMIFPTIGTAKAFYELVHPLDMKKAADARESRKLATLRDYLLPRLLSGRVRVGSREAADCLMETR